MSARAVARVCLIALAALATASSSAAAAPVSQASARSFAVRVVLADGTEEVLGEAVAPPSRASRSPRLDYGEGIVTTGGVWTRARALAGKEGRASAGATVRTISLFGGEITVGALSTRAAATASQSRVTGGLSGSWLADVTVLGQPVRAAPNARVQLGDWGYVVLLEQAVVRASGAKVGRRTLVSGLHVHVTADHGGLPAGSEIVVGYAEAGATASKAVVQPPSPPSAGVPVAPPKGPKRDPEPQPSVSPGKPPPVVQNPPPEVRPELTADRYVFPVYGPSSFTDDFAASRAITGWHHGNDIFAPVGAPILAVTDGTLFLVGWNDVGGNRLWLRDDQGNEFYFAHLSAFSPLAFEGSRVEAGDVIGFVGATGDAAGTPPHLHFEVHPAALLGLGYDGVVNPHSYLLAWRRVADATFDWGNPQPGKAPPPGIVLLQAEDISATSGLDAEALAQAMEVQPLAGDVLPPGEPAIVGSQPGLSSGSG
ncbi:MAG: M23 family metallopeptidase [Actinobacteria bacterium]|nr:M23 family metallopeptidase [Actinomycetota bacterium]